MENLCLCGDKLKNVKKLKNKYLKTCGKRECILRSKEQSMLTKYGVKHALQSKEINDKMKIGLIDKYGVDNISKLESVKTKKKETCKLNFGVEYPMQSNEVMSKSKSTLLELYGVDNISKLEDVIKKIQNTKNTIDISTGKTIFETAFEKRKKWYQDNYGVDYFFQTETFKENYKKIMLKKYNVDNYGKSDKFKDYMISKGHFKDYNECLLFNDYSRKVRNLTEKTFNKFFEELCSDNKRGVDYHLDHIYSIYDGFKNNIDVNIIASVYNLQIIPSIINKRKSINSWITKEELLERYYK